MTTTTYCPTTKPTLEYGLKGEAIAQLQELLNQRLAEIDTVSEYPLQIPVTGYFGEQTLDAVKYLQCLAFLKIDGIVGDKTWGYLCEGSNCLPQLSQGSNGVLVTAIQQVLKDIGFYMGEVDGIYGPKTAKAVRDFQISDNLLADGIIGPQTWNALIQLDVHASKCTIQAFDKV
jgi:peptidoglycan hydrolase-like protein with peptidoglycan-binding domain